MTNRSVEHWYPTAAYLYVLHQGGPALAWSTCAETLTTGATGCTAAADQIRRIVGACACWKIPPWMRATHIRRGSPITMA